MEYIKKIKKVIADKAGVELSEVDNDAFFEGDLNLGKMDLMDVLEQLEDELQIELVESISSFDTVQSLIDAVEEQVE